MTTYVSPSGLSIGDSEFWRRPLAERMADFAGLREQSAFIPEAIPSNVFGDETKFYSVIRHAENQPEPSPLLLRAGLDRHPRHANGGGRVLRLLYRYGRPAPREAAGGS